LGWGIAPVGGDFDLELRRLLFSIDDRSVRIRCVFVELDAKLETQLIELLGRILPSERLEERGLVDGDGGHGGGMCRLCDSTVHEKPEKE
jgi:hypothetical protein